MRVLVTGAAGFIGFHLARRFAERGDDVLGIDNLSDYYDVSLKQARLAELTKPSPLPPLQHRRAGRGEGTQFPLPSRHYSIGGQAGERIKVRGSFRFVRMDIADRDAMEELFAENNFDRVVHMAAQAGVRYSLKNPHSYVRSNLVGFMNVLEACRHQWSSSLSPPATTASAGRQGRGQGEGRFSESRIPNPESRHLVYASSSSVYGLNTKLPFSLADRTDHPISLYGATKKANEVTAHAYSHLYGIPTTGLRFFTVYGPWGRPDMALFQFARAILAGEPIDVYNDGKMRRDFTYIDDIVEGVLRVTDRMPSGLGTDPAASNVASRDRSEAAQGACPPSAPYKLYNIGNHSPVDLMDFIRAIEEALGRKAELNFLPMQPGDVPATFADVDDLQRDVGFAPKTPIAEGINKFIEWYRSFYR